MSLGRLRVAGPKVLLRGLCRPVLGPGQALLLSTRIAQSLLRIPLLLAEGAVVEYLLAMSGVSSRY